jgi:uncharacterized protein (TIGR02145 family)
MKISTYDIKNPPTLDDFVIGTDSPNSNKTKNFRIGDIVGLIGGATDYYFNREGTPYTNMTQVLAEISPGNRFPGQVVNIAGVDYYYLGTSYVIKPVYDYWVLRSGSTTVINNGYLYNWFAMTNASPLCTANAHVPTKAEWAVLFSYVGYGNINSLKEVGTVHWGIGNNGTDSYGFCALPSGILSAVGVGPFTTDVFTALGTDFMALYPDVFDTYTADGFDFSTTVEDNNSAKICAMPVRLIVDTPVEVVENIGEYYGNDGTKYKCVLIGSQWWTAENLIETKYRDGSAIPLVVSSPGANLSTGARYNYDNDETNSITATTNDLEVPVHQVVEFIAEDNIDIDLVEESGIIKVTVKQVTGTSKVDHISVFDDTEAKTLKSTSATIDDQGQVVITATADENSYSVALAAIAEGDDSYALFGAAKKMPVQGANLDVTPNTIKTGMSIRGDSAHMEGDGKAVSGYGLAYDFFIPVQGWTNPVLSEKLGARIVAKLITNTEGAEDVDIEVWGMKAGTLTLQATITHLGAIVPNP